MSESEWIRALRRGESQAAELLWQKYFDRLVNFARRKFGSNNRRVADEEDIALSALKSLFLGAGQGRFEQLRDQDSIWRLLVVIAARKVADQFEREKAQKRGGGAVRGESAFGHASGIQGVEKQNAEQPPDVIVQMAEECDRLMLLLRSESLRQLASWKMAGLTNDEIAEKLGCSRRTVARKLDLIRQTWTERFRE